MPLVNQETGEALHRDLVERDAEGHLVVVDLKTSARRYSDLQVDASLQLSVYRDATTMNGFADQPDLKLRSEVPTKTKQPELCRYCTTRDRAANVRLYRLAAEVLGDRGGCVPAESGVGVQGVRGQVEVLGVGRGCLEVSGFTVTASGPTGD